MPVSSVSQAIKHKVWVGTITLVPGKLSEISTICITDLKSNTAYALDSRQTLDVDGATRIVRYIAADAYYSKVKFVSKVVENEAASCWKTAS